VLPARTWRPRSSKAARRVAVTCGTAVETKDAAGEGSSASSVDGAGTENVTSGGPCGKPITALVDEGLFKYAYPMMLATWLVSGLSRTARSIFFLTIRGETVRSGRQELEINGSDPAGHVPRLLVVAYPSLNMYVIFALNRSSLVTGAPPLRIPFENLMESCGPRPAAETGPSDTARSVSCTGCNRPPECRHHHRRLDDRRCFRISGLGRAWG
jgi:hypothetical protein